MICRSIAGVEFATKKLQPILHEQLAITLNIRNKCHGEKRITASIVSQKYAFDDYTD